MNKLVAIGDLFRVNYDLLSAYTLKGTWIKYVHENTMFLVLGTNSAWCGVEDVLCLCEGMVMVLRIISRDHIRAVRYYNDHI